MKVEEKIVIRNETQADYKIVEEITRAAFWNLYIPGCVEHYLAHVLRGHADFIPALDLVAEREGQVVGNIMYTKAHLVDQDGNKKEILTFGPVCVHPKYQRMGYGKALMERSFQIAADLGYDTIVIFGSPSNYAPRGFISCKKRNICLKGGGFPGAMMVKELRTGALDGRAWTYYGSHAMEVTEEQAQAFDAGFEPWEKGHQSSQEEFYIYSHCVLVDQPGE